MPFFCSIRSSLAFIFIFVWCLFVLFSLFLYHNVFVPCIFRSLHNITTKRKQQQRRGYVQPLLLYLICYLILFAIIFFISNFYLLIMVSYTFFNNNKQHQQKQQQRKVVIDMITMLHCTKFALFYLF